MVLGKMEVPVEECKMATKAGANGTGSERARADMVGLGKMAVTGVTREEGRMAAKADGNGMVSDGARVEHQVELTVEDRMAMEVVDRVTLSTGEMEGTKAVEGTGVDKVEVLVEIKVVVEGDRVVAPVEDLMGGVASLETEDVARKTEDKEGIDLTKLD